MKTRTILIVGLLVVSLVLIAGCSQPPTEDNPASASQAQDAPDDIKTFYVETERGLYFCIQTSTGHSDTLSCTPIDADGEESP